VSTLDDLACEVPRGTAYVRLIRRGITYTGGPYMSPDAASESAARLFLHVPDATSVTVVPSPRLAPVACGRRWYALAVYKADGYTAVAGPFVSRREGRAHLQELAGRGQIGAMDAWDVCFRYVQSVS
jgi:hypothetical protein